MVTAWSVSGWLPNTLENLTRIVRPQRSGLTIERNVWLLAVAPDVLAFGNANARSGWMVARAYLVDEEPSTWFCEIGVEYKKYEAGAAAQLATHFMSPLP